MSWPKTYRLSVSSRKSDDRHLPRGEGVVVRSCRRRCSRPRRSRRSSSACSSCPVTGWTSPPEPFEVDGLIGLALGGGPARARGEAMAVITMVLRRTISLHVVCSLVSSPMGHSVWTRGATTKLVGRESLLELSRLDGAGWRDSTAGKTRREPLEWHATGSIERAGANAMTAAGPAPWAKAAGSDHAGPPRRCSRDSRRCRPSSSRQAHAGHRVRGGMVGPEEAERDAADDRLGHQEGGQGGEGETAGAEGLAHRGGR